MEFRFEGLEELNKKLNVVKDEFPDEAEKVVDKMTNRLRKHVRDKTPKSDKDHKRKLSKSYKKTRAAKQGDEISADFYATAPHFHLIDRGHQWVTPGGKRMGWVPGKFMVKQGVEELNGEATKILDKWADKLLKELKK